MQDHLFCLRRGRSATVNIGVDSGQFSMLSDDDVDPAGLQTTQVDGDTVLSRGRVTVGDSDTESFDNMPDEEPQSPESVRLRTKRQRQ